MQSAKRGKILAPSAALREHLGEAAAELYMRCWTTPPIQESPACFKNLPIQLVVVDNGVFRATSAHMQSAKRGKMVARSAKLREHLGEAAAELHMRCCVM